MEHSRVWGPPGRTQRTDDGTTLQQNIDTVLFSFTYTLYFAVSCPSKHVKNYDSASLLQTDGSSEPQLSCIHWVGSSCRLTHLSAAGMVPSWAEANVVEVPSSTTTVRLFSR